MILRSLVSAARPTLRPAGRSLAPLPSIRVRGLSSTPLRTARRPVSVPTPELETPTCSPEPVVHEPFDRGLAYRRGLLLFSLPVPPEQWPSHVESMSPILGDAQFALKAQKLGVNVTYDGTGTAASLDGLTSLPAELVYPDGKVFKWEHFDSKTLDSAEFQEAMRYTAAQPAMGELARVQRVLVCTHGSRDCRCHDRGAPLVAALRALQTSSSTPIEVREIAHVGGHKWAANALLFPSLDMFSNLDAARAGAFLRFLESRGAEEAGQWAHWRGRMGYNDLVQMRLGLAIDRKLESVPGDGEGVSDASKASAAAYLDTLDGSGAVDPMGALDGGLGGFGGLDAQVAQAKWKGKPTVPLTFTTFTGDLISVDAPVGASLLEVGKIHDLPSLEGTCGGNCECATCHLYLDPSGAEMEGREGEVEEAPVEEPSEEEYDMLSAVIEYRDGESRLGCQIPVSRELSDWNQRGGRLRLPKY